MSSRQYTPHRHHGIPCSLKGSVCRVIAGILGQITRRAPRDYTRLRLLVRRFTALPRRETYDGTQGEWCHPNRDDFDEAGIIKIDPAAEHLTAVLAHELGHACTREQDFDRRGGDSEWASEMSADAYAYKWGFGREIARHRPHRSLAHHGPAPRSEFTEGPMETPAYPGRKVVYRSRVSRHFCIHLIQVETPEGELIETAEQYRARMREEMEERMRAWRNDPRHQALLAQLASREAGA